MFRKLLFLFLIAMIHFHQSDFRCTRRRSIASTIIGTVAATRILNKTCPVDWLQNFSRCYYFNALKKTSLGAETFCKNNNSTLVIIRNTDQMNFLAYSVCPSFQLEFHVGAKAIGYFKFAWNDNTTLLSNRTYWSSGEPNNYLGNSTYINEGCVTGLNSQDGLVYFNDASCSQYWLPSICEKPVEYV